MVSVYFWACSQVISDSITNGRSGPAFWLPACDQHITKARSGSSEAEPARGTARSPQTGRKRGSGKSADQECGVGLWPGHASRGGLGNAQTIAFKEGPRDPR